MSEETSQNLDHPSSCRTYSQRLWFRLLRIVLIGYLVWCTGLYVMQDRLVFPADLAPRPGPNVYNEQTVVLRHDIGIDGTAEAWFIPVSNASVSPAPVVIFFHGNAEIIDHQIDIIEQYLQLGVSVLLPEYRGYGRASGSPSQRGITADLVVFYDQLIERGDVDPARIVFHGRSVGGGLASSLARHRNPAAMILQSTFTSAASMAHRYLAPSFLVKNPLHVDDVVEAADFPLLLFHGNRDRIIPVSHGRKLHNLKPAATYVEFDCGHNDFPGPGNEQNYWNEIRNFLTRNEIIEE